MLEGQLGDVVSPEGELFRVSVDLLVHEEHVVAHQPQVVALGGREDSLAWGRGDGRREGIAAAGLARSAGDARVPRVVEAWEGLRVVSEREMMLLLGWRRRSGGWR